ncbi:AAA family ATPase [Helicobacter pylori]|uniref:AAA family ATPase n=1 Tax=Helicobacter pylori TaxID=210 RepID=UPI0007225E70|nr:AAA family ATPase [Helicobacter pylori]ALM81075.1 AAA family ATPase [Helicobacter pylori]MBH0236092.1 AAA family ATPase [Helicobacter pylori]MBH0250884.1 AAA family ATPase [Helicobacter pylori]MBH0269953.1 AAA family ATPase [Helicobacter pylori]WQY82257.1 AAA family ATPase [Helicobacter pylori]
MAVNIKKIKSLKAFCGLGMIEMDEFKHYNIIFGNNGCGKTSLTRAFELLIPKNKHIEKYRTISAAESPSIEFECEDRSYKIEPNSDIRVPPFKVEIYNSDFLHNNMPLNSEFGLKKLDDGTIILEGSVLGEETKEINQLKDFREKVEKRQKKIKDENDTENTLSAKQESEIKKYDKEIERIRQKMTSNTIKITPDEIGINNFYKVSKDKFKYQEDVLTNLEKDFNKLNEAMKKFDGLKEMELPKDYQTIKDKLEFLFSFDIDKEAGEVSKKIKEHISKVGREFIEKGIELQKEMPDNACPFCTQKIPHEIIQEYTSYFNKSVEKFNQCSLEMSGTLKNILDQWNIKEILQAFEQFKPFMEDFSQNKESLENALERIKVLLEKLQKEVDKKEGAKNEKKFQKIDKELLEIQENIQKHVGKTRNILNQKKEQEEKLKEWKTKLKEARIKKAKHDSYDWQKSKEEAERKLSVLNRRHERLNRLLEKIDNKLKELNDQKRPDIKIINNYLKALNLPKYSLDKDYRIVLNSDVLENSEAEMILSDGEKTTLAFAYFLARLKLFYKKEDLKDLVVIIDDPISSLDEQRIYNTSYIVAKINQELAGEALKDEDKVQVFVLTHNHTFMARLINMVGKHARYFQLERHQNQLKIVCKNEVVGYFDTFYLLLFKEVYEFAKKEKVQDDFKEAINYGNKVRILLESFLKINFIDSFLTEKHDGVFKEDMLKHLIETANGEVELNFSKLPFNKDNNCNIKNKDMLRKKILHIAKGLHLDSHGSVVDFFSPYKIPLENVQKFAKIAINAMKILNPYQTQSYMGSVDKETKNKE